MSPKRRTCFRPQVTRFWHRWEEFASILPSRATPKHPSALALVRSRVLNGFIVPNNPEVERTRHKLEELANQSGFPLQIGISTLVQRTTESHHWRVIYTEHSWKNPTDGASGFVDLVLERWPHRRWVLVIECKRVLESSWIFLNPKATVTRRSHAKAWVTKYADGSWTKFEWSDLNLDPTTPESQYCVVPGQDSKSKPMLERVASELVSATEALAFEEKLLRGPLRIYFSVIVTTAGLKVCSFDPERISIKDGKIPASEFSDVRYVRFRKQLSPLVTTDGWLPLDGSSALASSKERTVFVVNSEAFSEFLSEFECYET